MHRSMSPSADAEWECFQRLTNDELASECQIYKNVEKEMTAEWEHECKKYEQSLTVLVDGEMRQVPRRNYINGEARVKDSVLFPYHSSCYALLDAYDGLYDSPSDEQPVPKNAVQAYCFPPPPVYVGPPRNIEEIQGYLPCSVRAIAASIFRISQVVGLVDGEEAFFEFLQSLARNGLEPCLREGCARPSFEDILSKAFVALPLCFVYTPSQSGPVEFPCDQSEIRHLLLKLLKHATSEIQRDHVLAHATLSRLLVEGHLEDIECFRRVLTLLMSEYIFCEYPCDEPEDHVCDEWDRNVRYWVHIFAYHTFAFTKDHGLAIAGLVRHLFLREFGHLRRNSGHSFGEKLKSQLKRTLVMQREDYDDRETEDSSSAVPGEMVLAAILGLRERACLERRRLEGFLNEASTGQQTSNEQIEHCLTAYTACLSALLSIADSASALLPPIERFFSICSAIVTSLTLSLIGTEEPYYRPESYIGAEREDLAGLVTPFRLADTVRRATKLSGKEKIALEENQSPRDALLNQCRQVLFGHPPQDIRVAVRRLFVRDMVHLQDAWLGYSDFLVWCRYGTDPLDPVLFCHEFNFHIDADEEESDEENDGSEDNSQWDLDESGNVVASSDLPFRFDFTLLALQCAWYEPWSVETDATYQPGFRVAVHQVALCLLHNGMPKELHGHIVQYFSRDWWPDNRLRCWQYDCMVEQTEKEEECRDAGEPYVPPPVKLCEGCRVSAYCSRNCREADWKDGHKQMCGRPPYRRPTPADYRFCEVIYRNEPSGGQSTARSDENAMEEDILVDGDIEDDEGSWESVDSEDESGDSGERALDRTSQIRDFLMTHNKALLDQRRRRIPVRLG